MVSFRTFLTMVLFVALISSCATSRRNETSPRIISLKNDFQKFFDPKLPNHKELSRKFFRKNHRIYANLVYPELVGQQGMIVERQKRLTNYLKDNPDNFQKINRTFTALESTAAAQIKRFKDLFPKADYDYEIYLLPSMLWFSGRAGFSSPSSLSVSFGVDNIAKNNENISILFPHEMFHALHFKSLKLNRNKQISYGKDLLSSLWIEGFASYVSGLSANVSTTPSSVFGKIGAQCEFQKRMLHKTFIEDMKVSPTTGSIIDRWFGSGDKIANIPPMAGYCLGLWTVKHMHQRYTLAELLKWRPEEKRRDIIEALQSI